MGIYVDQVKQVLKKPSQLEWKKAVDALHMGTYGPRRWNICYRLPEEKNKLSPFLKQLFRGIDFDQDSISLGKQISKRLEKSRTVGFVKVILSEKYKGKVYQGDLDVVGVDKEGGCILTMPIEADVVIKPDRYYLHSFDLDRKEQERKSYGGKIYIDWPLSNTFLPELATYALKRTWEGKLYFKTNTPPSYQDSTNLPAPPYLITVPKEISEKLTAVTSSAELGGMLRFSYQLSSHGKSFPWAISVHLNENVRWEHWKSTLLPPFNNCLWDTVSYLPDDWKNVLQGYVSNCTLVRVVDFVFVKPLKAEDDFKNLLKAHALLKQVLVNQKELEGHLSRYLKKKAERFVEIKDDLFSKVYERLFRSYQFPKKSEFSPFDKELPIYGFAAYINATLREESKKLWGDSKKVRLIPGVWTVKEAASFLGCSSSWIYNLIKKGKLSSINKERHLLTDKEIKDLRNQIEEKETKADIYKVLIRNGITMRAARRWVERRFDKGLPIELILKEAIKKTEDKLGDITENAKERAIIDYFVDKRNMSEQEAKSLLCAELSKDKSLENIAEDIVEIAQVATSVQFEENES